MGGEMKPIKLQGIAASPGKFYGKIQKIVSRDHWIVERHIQENEVEFEIQKFLHALQTTKQELLEIIQKNLQDIPKDILQAQIIMLNDPVLIENVKRQIQEHKETAELALFHVIQKISKNFENLEDEYFRERAADIQDLGKRIENNLLGKTSSSELLANLDTPIIIIATELSASQILNLNKKWVKGIVTERGGKTGHMAILARYFQIPAVVGLPNLLSQVLEDEFLFLDGDNGFVIRNPNINQIKRYGYQYPLKVNKQEKKLKPVTLDGTRINLKINLESKEDIPIALTLGADGVGLYRTETLLMLHSKHELSEEFQFNIYKEIIQGLHDKPVVLRTFDVGADKFSVNNHEENPALGERGIRYSLTNPEWFKVQLKAILRASAFGKVDLLLPMVTELSEVKITKDLLQECKKELLEEKIPFGEFSLGIMIETPASALNVDLFLEHIDFLSLGTNDLLQYFVAVDRNNHKIAHLYNPLNYSFLKVLQELAEKSNQKNKPISVCGELASDVNFTILLLGLGFREFSVSLPFLNKIQKLISKVSLSDAQRLANKVLELSAQEKFEEAETFLFNLHLQEN